MDRPNVLFVQTDSQRGDCLGCYGNPVLRTPHLDALAAQGVRFDRCYVQNPVCRPSRAALLTGQYPHLNGVLGNQHWLPTWAVTLPQLLLEHGYYTISIGKMHFGPVEAPLGFARRIIAEGKYYQGDDDYRRYLGRKGLLGRHRVLELPECFARYGALASSLPEADYIDTFVGERAVEWLAQNAQEPFFAWVSFPSPHYPFDPPEPYASLYDPQSVPPPHRRPGELEDKPPHQLQTYRRGGPANHFPVSYQAMTEGHVRRVIAHYYGMISLIDHQVGRLVDALRARGQLERTVVVFTSDHGELLGDHWLLLKGCVFYEPSVRVPLIVRHPARLRADLATAALVEQIDLFPTLLELAGVPQPPHVRGQGRSLVPLLTGERDDHRPWVFSEWWGGEALTAMLATQRWKLVHFAGHPYGELYDLEADPYELYNRWRDPECRAVRQDLEARLLEVLCRAAVQSPVRGYGYLTGSLA